MTAVAAPSAGLEFGLPDGWWCLDLLAPRLAPRLADLIDDVRASRPPVPAEADHHALACMTWLRDRGASIALLRPGDQSGTPAICGGVFVHAPLPVTGAELCAALDADGEAVALGDLDGIPVISHVGRRSAGIDAVQVTYLLCAPAACVVLTFTAPELSGVKCVVDEVAHVVSAARLVHSASGCPV